MFDKQQAWPKRQRASESHAHPQCGIEIAHATLPRRLFLLGAADIPALQDGSVKLQILEGASP